MLERVPATWLCCLSLLTPACAILGGDTADSAADGGDTEVGDTEVGDGSGATSSGSTTAVDPDGSSSDTPEGTAATSDDPSGTDPTDDTATTGPDDALDSAVATMIATGRLHSCALIEDGTVRCWGYAELGQLGNGAPLDTLAFDVPVEVMDLEGVTAISSFSDHTCALDDAGAVWCWGDNAFGQLGDGTTSPSNVPLRVPGLTGVDLVAAGWEHNCAVLADGGAVCWGKNDYGQLGNDSNVDSSTPVAVSGLADVISIAAGRYHSCAVTGDGAAWCWGGDTFGELGDDEALSASYVPVGVAGLGSGVRHIAAGDSVGCAITDTGAARCWGVNNAGQLGNGESGSFVESHTPVGVVGLDSGVTSISPGFGYTCAVVDGAAQCWGSNYNGELGVGEDAGFVTATPVGVVGLGSGAAAIGACSSHACALTTSGEVRCWGNNDGGALGDGTLDSSNVPVAVVSLP